MSKIFLFSVPTGRGTGAVRDSTVGGDVIGYALAEDGECLATHYSSSPSFARHDLGFTSDWKHDSYKKKYPDGFVLVWAGDTDDELDTYAEFSAAFALNKQREDGEHEEAAK